MPIELSGEELEDQIQVEAEQYIPYPIDEVSLDYEILGPSPDNPEINEILLAASRTENVDICVAALGLGGLVAKVIDVEGFAVENACGLITEQIDTSGDALMAVINIGAAMTTLSVLRNRHTIYSREQSFRGQQFTEEMMRVDPLSSEEAEHAILQQGLPETHTAETLTPFKDSLVQQVSRLIEFFYSGSGYSKISQVVLSGDYASIEGIDTMLEEQLGVRCVVANPLVHMNLPAHQKESLIRDASALMVVTGLALRSFD